MGDNMYYLGIDLGGTNIAIGLVDQDLKIVLKDSVPTGASRPIDAIMDDIDNILAGCVSEEWLTKFVEVLKGETK